MKERSFLVGKILNENQFQEGDFVYSVDVQRRRKNGPTVDELGEGFRHTAIVKLGRLALFNLLSKRVVRLNTSEIGLIAKFDPDMFKSMVDSPRPTCLGAL